MTTTSNFPGLVMTLLLIFAASGAEGSRFPRSKARSPKRSLFPGPVTPEKVCAGPNAPRTAQPAPDLRNEFMRLLVSARGVSRDSKVLLLQYAENMVRNRGYFFSLAFQMQDSFWDFAAQPGFLYYYISAATALFTSPPALVGSGVFFDADKHYPNWYKSILFNHTMNRFAPRAKRLSTADVSVDDYGADDARDYTSPLHGSGLSPWTTVFRLQRQTRQGEVKALAIHAVDPQMGLESSDVYHDCLDGGRWLFTLGFPVTDVLARYSSWTFLRKPSNVAQVTADVDVENVVSGLLVEVQGSHNVLAVTPDCPGPVPPAPGSGTLGDAFFRSLYPQSGLAVRLAHSMGAFLQIEPEVTHFKYQQQLAANFPDTPSARLKADIPMNDTLLEAEVLANLLADQKILASGVFFEAEQYHHPATSTIRSTPRKAFQAWRGPDGAVVGDLSASKNPHIALSQRAGEEWGSANTDPRLQTFSFHAGIRSSRTGGGLAPFEVDPLSYRAVSLAEGYWTSLHFKCDGYVASWVVTYAAPFFGPSVTDPTSLVLKGIVTVDIAVTADNWVV